jgi:hypothetical protein
MMGLLIGDENQSPLLRAAVRSAVLIIPVSVFFRADPGKGRTILGAYTAALVALSLAALAASQTGSGAINPWEGLFWVGLLVYTWVANIVASLA